VSADDRLLTQQAEPESLNAFLDWYRAVAANKIRGLSDDDAKRIITPTGLCPLGVVAHLAWAERLWFRWRFAGEELEGVEHGGDNSPTFQVAASDTVASVIAAYEDEAERARRIVAATPSLDQLAVRTSANYGIVSLRWLILHMIEETARHAGHLDIMRELIDGQTGS
jgi:uncharacterized damage-inducible protein DinB